MNTQDIQENPSPWKVVLLAASLSLLSGQAGAQDNSQPANSGEQTEVATKNETDAAKKDKQKDENSEEENKSIDLGRVEVTGSLIKREDFVSTSPVQIINADTQAQVGQLEMADILQGSTVAAGTTQLNNQFNGFVIQGGTGVQTPTHRWQWRSWTNPIFGFGDFARDRCSTRRVGSGWQFINLWLRCGRGCGQYHYPAPGGRV